MFLIKKHCRQCRTAPSPGKGICINCKTDEKATANPESIVLRYNVIRKLGGKCSTCPEGRLGCLDIDHINGDGAEHRKELKDLGYEDFYAIYKYLVEHNYKCNYELQILCRRCHNKKHYAERHPNGGRIIMYNGRAVS